MTVVSLKNFRCYKDTSFTIMDHGSEFKLAKICGDNGSGKTTLLESIYYCLYGTLLRVKPRDGGDVEVTVELPYKDGTITIRRRTKNDVRVWIGDETYEGDRAQSIIDDWFGDSDSFLLTSYLRAETMHKFISATPAEKREITHLLFPDSREYEKKVSALKEIRKIEEEELDKRERQKIAVVSAIDTMVQSYPWLVEDADMRIEDIPDTVDSGNAKIKKAHPIIAQYHSLKVDRPDDIEVDGMTIRIEE